MAGPHFKRKLIHTAAVRRVTRTQNSEGELIEAWATSGTINVRYIQQSHRMADEGAGYPMVLDHIALCNAGEDVTEEDRLGNIRFRSTGVLVDAGPFEINSCLERNTGGAHHISLKLEKIE